MTDLSTLLQASLSPDTRKKAEHELNLLSIQPSFLPTLLHLILDFSQTRAVRLSAGVFLKNVTRTRWEEVYIVGISSLSEY
jgi:exportin-2 (importin alpha re-exporter)